MTWTGLYDSRNVTYCLIPWQNTLHRSVECLQLVEDVASQRWDSCQQDKSDRVRCSPSLSVNHEPGLWEVASDDPQTDGAQTIPTHLTPMVRFARP